ncbi:hypothetical protein IAU60_006931 [Kwoniella sp. DSM 27419]
MTDGDNFTAILKAHELGKQILPNLSPDLRSKITSFTVVKTVHTDPHKLPPIVYLTWKRFTLMMIGWVGEMYDILAGAYVVEHPESEIDLVKEDMMVHANDFEARYPGQVQLFTTTMMMIEVESRLKKRQLTELCMDLGVDKDIAAPSALQNTRGSKLLDLEANPFWHEMAAKFDTSSGVFEASTQPDSIAVELTGPPGPRESYTFMPIPITQDGEDEYLGWRDQARLPDAPQDVQGTEKISARLLALDVAQLMSAWIPSESDMSRAGRFCTLLTLRIELDGRRYDAMLRAWPQLPPGPKAGAKAQPSKEANKPGRTAKTKAKAKSKVDGDVGTATDLSVMGSEGSSTAISQNTSIDEAIEASYVSVSRGSRGGKKKGAAVHSPESSV